MRRAMIAVVLSVVFCGGVSAQDTSPIVCEGVVEAPMDSVWGAWTTSGGLRSWLAPHADIDLRVGGLMRTNYDPAGALGDPKTIENAILSFEPKKMLSIKVTRTPDGFPFPAAIRNMWTVIYFDSLGQDRTRVRIVGLGFEDSEESQKMRDFFDRGNTVTLQELQSRYAKGGQ